MRTDVDKLFREMYALAMALRKPASALGSQLAAADAGIMSARRDDTGLWRSSVAAEERLSRYYVLLKVCDAPLTPLERAVMAARHTMIGSAMHFRTVFQWELLPMSPELDGGEMCRAPTATGYCRNRRAPGSWACHLPKHQEKVTAPPPYVTAAGEIYVHTPKDQQAADPLPDGCVRVRGTKGRYPSPQEISGMLARAGMEISPRQVRARVQSAYRAAELSPFYNVAVHG